MNPNNFNLEKVGSAFDSWRASRRDNHSPIPEELWSMVKTIYPHYSRGSICLRLGLSSAQLKRRGYGVEGEANVAASSKPNNDAASETQSFIHITPPSSQANFTNNAMIEVIRPDSTAIRLHHLQDAQVERLFQQLVGG